MTTFSLDLGVAEKFGLIEQPQGVSGYVLGPNLQFTCPPVTYTDKTHPGCGDATNRFDQGGDGSNVSSENKRLHLSWMVEWQFNNLNASFEKLVGTSERTLMVYSDVVESSVVGSGKFPLLREAQLLRKGNG